MFNIPTYLIEQQVLATAASSVTFDDITAQVAAITAWTPRHLVIRVNGRSTRATTNAHVEITLNSDTGNNYNSQNIRGAGSSTSAARTTARDYLWRCFIPGSSVAANAFGGGEGLIPDAFSTRSHKSFIGMAATVEALVEVEAARWADTSAITSVTFTADANEMVAGTTIDLAVVDESFNHSEQII